MKKIITCAVLASAALATPALAQDNADKGWYFGLRTGVASLNDPDFSITDTSITPNIQLDTKLETKSAWSIGGETGYDFGGVRVGIDLAYQRNTIKGINLRSVNGTTISATNAADVVDELGDYYDFEGAQLDGTTIRATSGSVAKLRQLAVMAHVTYDIPLKGPVTPYVGVGLGAVGTHLKALGEDDGSVQFAWQLRAGAAVKVTRGVDLTADYTYRQTSGGKLQFGDDEDVVYRLGKTKASLFQVGLRFTF